MLLLLLSMLIGVYALGCFKQWHVVPRNQRPICIYFMDGIVSHYFYHSSGDGVHAVSGQAQSRAIMKIT